MLTHEDAEMIAASIDSLRDAVLAVGAAVLLTVNVNANTASSADALERVLELWRLAK